MIKSKIIALENILPVAFILLISCAVYSRTFSYGLLEWDDQLHLTENPFIQPDSPHRYAYFWEHPYGKLFIPITYNAWGWLYARCFDGQGHFSAHWLRTANIAAHAIAAALVYVLFLELLTIDRRHITRFAALIGALFFALHPLQVESVSWISEFRGLLASIFALTAMVFYFIDIGSRGKPTSISVFLRHYIAPSLFLAAGFLCKPSVAGVPLILFVIDVFWFRTPLRKVFTSLAAPMALTCVSLLLMRNIQPSDANPSVPILLRPFVAGDALAFYFAKLAWPFSLAADYSRTPEFAQTTTWFWFAWIVPVALIALGVSCWIFARSGLILTACGIFIAALLPILGFVPFEFQHISTIADRYAYLALIGPALIISRLSIHSRLATILFIPLLALLAWRSFDQTRSWQNGDTLWQHAVAVNPHAVIATGNVAHALAERGDRAHADQLFHRVIELTPHRAAGYRGLGRLAADTNESAIALDWYQKACEADPFDAPSHDGAGSMLVALGRPSEAERQFRESLRLDPAFADGWNNLGALLLQRKRPAEARAAFENALTINPRHPQALINLANAETAIGDDAAAEQALHHAVELLKQNPLPAKLLGQRALAQHDWKSAERWFRLAICIDPKDVSAINDLGQTLAAEGNLDESITTFQSALSLRPDSTILKENLESATKLKRRINP